MSCKASAANCAGLIESFPASTSDFLHQLLVLDTFTIIGFLYALQGTVNSSMVRCFEASEMTNMSGQSDVVTMCIGIGCCFPTSIWSHQSLAVWRRSVAICGHARGIFPALTRCVAYLRAWRCLLVLMAQVKVHVTAWTIWSWHQWQWQSAKAFGQLLRRYSKVCRSYQDMKVTWTWQGIINCLH